MVATSASGARTGEDGWGGPRVRSAIVGACGLIGLGGSGAEATEVRTAVLGYTEPHRVSALEAIIDGQYEFASGKIANFRLVYDALSGASANGAAPASFAQTFTRPSGKGTYVTAPGETPLDDTFHDTRVAGSAGMSLPVGRMNRFAFGVYGSGEYDYTSLGGNLSLTRDFDQRNTTVAVRGAYFSDTISPEGGRPAPLTPMPDQGIAKTKLPGDGSKGVMDLGVGLTQVVDRKTIFHVNYTYSHVSDYQTDPFKMLSAVDPATGDPRPTDPYLYESRPDARTKHVVFGRLSRHLGPDVVQFSYRFFTDDWGVGSHTLDLTYRWNLQEGSYLKPHLRYYRQAAANFYRRYLVDGEALPSHASADYRLGDMDAFTYGLIYGHRVGEHGELTVRAEYYAQTGESYPAGAIGGLANYDLFPTVDAFIVQVGYAFALLD